VVKADYTNEACTISQTGLESIYLKSPSFSGRIFQQAFEVLHLLQDSMDL
jgi:hypothetical protein